MINKCYKCNLEFKQRHNMLRHNKNCNFDMIYNVFENLEPDSTNTNDLQNGHILIKIYVHFVKYNFRINLFLLNM
jgi:hypothetical protein